MFELSNEDLLARLRSGEDNFTERKTFQDKNGWLKTAVAFANSVPIDWPGILFIGITNAGAFESPAPDLEKLGMDVTQQISRAYPPIFHLPKVVIDENGSKCLAVLIPGSAERPHFSGKSYVRIGPRSEEASEQQFRELLSKRLGKTRAILEWKDKLVRILTYPRHSSASKAETGKIVACNSFYVTIEFETPTKGLRLESFPLDEMALFYDHSNDRLALRRNE